MTHERKVAEEIIFRLMKWKAYLYYEATTGSCYVKFPHWALGSIRVGDHKGLSRYTYRWRVRLDKPVNFITLYKEKNVWVKEYGLGQLDQLVIDFEESATRRNVHPGEHQTWAEARRPNK
jgi:hypothetical protein